MATSATRLSFGSCEDCVDTKYELVQAFHNRFGVYSFDSTTNWPSSNPIFIQPAFANDFRKWIGAGRFYLLAPLTNPSTGEEITTFPSPDNFMTTLNLQMPQGLNYQQELYAGPSHYQEYARFWVYRCDFNVNSITGVVTATYTKVTLSDRELWIDWNSSGDWVVDRDGTSWPRGKVEWVWTNSTANARTFQVRISYFRYVGGFKQTKTEILGTFSEFLTTENSDENMLSVLDTLLDGPWIDYNTGTTGITWDNQFYFDVNVAHNQFYFVWYDPDTETKYIEAVDGEDFDFEAEYAKKNLWIGYQTDRFRTSTTWFPAGRQGYVFSKTRVKVKTDGTATIKLNRSDLDWRGISTITNHIPFCDIYSVDGAHFVYDDQETDVTDISSECSGTPFFLDAPPYSTKQGWYHIYL